MKRLTLFFTAITLLVVSCKKDDNTEVTPQVYVPKIKCEITYSPGTPYKDSVFYEYDSQGRVTKQLNKKSGEYEIYSYETNKVIIKYFSSTNKLTGTETNNLNEKGKVIDGTKPNYLNEMGNFKYTYDNAGKLLKYNYISTSCTDSTIYEYDTNLLRVISKSSTGGIKSIDSLTNIFYPDKISTIEKSNYGKSFYPLENTYLTKTEIMYGQTLTHTYEFDTKNNVTSNLVKNNSDTVYIVWYQYVN